MALRDSFSSLFKRNSAPTAVTNSTIKITDHTGFGTNRMRASLADEVCITPLEPQKQYAGIVFAAIRNRANATATLLTEDLQTTRNGEPSDREHPYREILDKSKKQSNFRFFYELSIMLDLTGDGFVAVDRVVQQFKNRGIRVGNVQSFEALRSYYVKPIMTADKMDVEYWERTYPGTMKMQKILPQQMIHIDEYNPFEEILGFPIMKAADAAAYIDREASEHTAAAMKGNLSASGILGLDAQLNDKDLDNFEADIDRKFSGKRGNGKPIIANGSKLNWTDSRYDLNKMALEAIKNLSREELSAIFGVSKTILGIEQSGVTRETGKIQRQLYHENHIVPRAKMILDEFNQDFKVHYMAQYAPTKPTMVIKAQTDLDQVEQEVKIDSAKLDVAKKAYELGMSRRYIAETILEVPEEDLDKIFDHEPTFDKEPVVELQPRTAQSINSTEHTHDHSHEADERDEVPKHVVNALTRKDYSTIINAQEKLVGVVKKWQTNYLKAAIGNIRKNAVVTEAEGAALQDSLRKGLDEFYLSIYPVIMANEAEKTVKAFGLESSDVKLTAQLKQEIRRRSKIIAASHNTTVEKQIAALIDQARELGSSRTKLANQIRELFNEKITKSQATRIAVTETTHSFNEANLLSDLQLLEANNATQQFEMVWTTNSSNPCPACVALEGTAVPVGNDFYNPGDDVFGTNEDGSQYKLKTWEQSNRGQSPLHSNCLCTYRLRRSQ